MVSAKNDFIAADTDIRETVVADVDAAVAAAVGLRLIGWAAKESDGTPAVATFSIVNGVTGAWNCGC